MLRTVILFMLTITFALTLSVNAETESFYQGICANLLKGKTEVYLSDKTRIDILTETEAIEVDFARKWAEGIGQALHYSTMTQRHAGLILIIEEESDARFVKRVQDIIRIKSLRISLYTIDKTTQTLTRIE